MKDRILLVEDDSTLSMIVSETLQRDGFEVMTAGDGEDGLRKFTRHGADLIIADVMMPRMDGFEMGRRIRQINRNVPLLFLTAKSEIDDIVEGFELGGNDYLKKPFKMLELIVRIKALLRKNVIKEDNQFEIGDYTLDLSTQILSHKDTGGIELSLIEAKLLKELIVNVGHTVDASTMMQLVWQRDDPYSRNSLHGFIHKLRNYLRYDPSISLINQRGIGYMLTAKRE
ncbi:response regulator transcription factor [Paramuribaculum intestinale]|jgi:DNA-binding response OmpR family regulator|uniref:response regulator transcription factor n=1 Tax=Paramuribaculum intestinale TaxID=2094151 RepID=UPI000D1DD273|nr:response regulator transcription factor [Paramuribaculum intestinale]MBJ2185358.1 response regulator transcription factor [Muribaculaceae bacterium]PWB09238.1 DNA-binding response regulator [Paramuribaculum intestinale]WLT42107.1 response regulator transcription factor [Paramuribaculum intestinale]